MIYWFLGAAALSVLVWGWAAFRGAPRAGGLAALLIAGSAAQLWLTEPDYYFFLRLSPDRPADAVMMALIALQGTISLLALWPQRQAALRVARALGAGRLALLALLCSLLVTPLNGFLWRDDLRGYGVHLVVGAMAMMAGLANLGALLAAPDLHRLALQGAARERFVRASTWLLPLLVFAGAAVLSAGVIGGMAVVQDETAYLFQARTFAAGMLRAPPLPAGAEDAFEYYLLTSTPESWYAVTPPGWPAVLALGVALGVPLLVNPALGALAVVLGHRLATRWSGPRAGVVTALLMATSPMLLILSASLMTHALALALTLGGWALGTAALDRARAGRPGSSGLAFAAGLAMGWLFLTRALEGLIVGTLTGIWLLGAFGFRRLGPVLAYSAGCIATGSLLFAYNWALTGDPLSMPLTLYLDEIWHPGANAFGFGPDIGAPGGWGALDMEPGHSPSEALANTVTALSFLGLELQGWPWSSLVLIWAALIWGPADRLARLMLGLAAAVIGLHALYWYSANFYIGPRYWYVALFAFAVLAASGLASLARRTAAVATGGQERLMVVLVLTCVFGGLVFTGWRAVGKFAPRVAPAHEVAQQAEVALAATGPDALVLLPCHDALEGAMIQNDPLLRSGRPIFALSRGAEADADLLTALPGRRAVTLEDACDQRG